MKEKIPVVIILISILVIFGIIFYWFSIRPSQIRKQCSLVPVKTYSQEKKDEAKKYVDEKCPTDKGWQAIDCVINKGIINAPSESQNQKRSATDDEYIKCLRENGLADDQSIASKQLKTLQQGINNQSVKIDDLQKENTSTQNDLSSAGIQSIIQSSIDKTDRENKEKCQQDLSEYNTCLSEYNSKMAEYNSCLSESSDPNSWRYKSFCSKPSNYCFKPVCAY
jgi:uncharacterized protein YaaR (DUF327 family)